MAIRDFRPHWSVNAVHSTGLLICHGQDLFGIVLGPQSISGPLPYVQVHMGFTGEMSPRDVTLFLDRGITRKALRALVAFVLRMVDATHFRHSLPEFKVTPDFCKISKRSFMSTRTPATARGTTQLTYLRLGKMLLRDGYSGRMQLSSGGSRPCIMSGTRQCWYSSSVVRSADPLPSVGPHSVLLLDLCQADVPIFGPTGRVLWSLEYGYGSVCTLLGVVCHTCHNLAALQISK